MKTTISSLQEQMEALKGQIAKLREEQKAQVKSLKEEEAKFKAQSIAKALASQVNNGSKRNITAEVRECMTKGMTVDEMMKKLELPRKSILDRRWLVEKSLGLR